MASILSTASFQPRIGADQLGLELAAVVERDRDVIGVEHVAPDGEDVPLVGNQETALIGLQPAHAAGAVDLDHLGLIVVDRPAANESAAATCAHQRATAARQRDRQRQMLSRGSASNIARRVHHSLLLRGRRRT